MRLFSLSLLLGTLIIQWLDHIPSLRMVLILLILVITMSGVTVFFFKKRPKKIDTLLISLSALLLGLLLASFNATDLVSNIISQETEGQELLITGKVVDIPSVRGDGVRFLFDVYSSEFVDGTLPLSDKDTSSKSLNNLPLKRDDGLILDDVEGSQEKISLKGLVRLGWYQQAQKLQAGEIWQLKVKLKRPSGFMNPGGFDYEKWLFTQKIIATGYVRKTKGLETNNLKLNQTITPEVLWSVDSWRQKIHEAIQERVENKSSSAILSAIVVAVRDKLDDKQWQLLQATGTSHLIAISGLHIAVVAGFAFFPIMLLWRLFPGLNERIPLRIAGAFVGTLFAIIYAMLAGFTLPTQRALLMVVIGLWGLVSRRNYDASTILALALILVLLWDPLAAMTVSFWLSFLAVFLIMLFVKRQIEKPRWMILKLQVYLSLAMLPLTLMFFGTASLTSPIANLFAIPWVSFLIVPLSLLALLLMPISTFLSTQLLKLAAYTVEILFKALALLGDSALSKLSLAEIPTSMLIVAFIGVLVLILPKGFPARWLGLLLIIPVAVYQESKSEIGEFTYTLLDVGQGYASVLQTRNHNLVYDTGARVGETFDLGKLVVGPYLRSRGINKINSLMISHEDIDHRGGAQYLIDNFEIDEVFNSGVFDYDNIGYGYSNNDNGNNRDDNDNNDNSENRDNNNSTSNKNRPQTAAKTLVKACLQGQSWQWDGVNFEVLSPQADYQGNDNNRSCVLKVWNQHHSLLLTGDIQKKTEKALILSSPNKLQAEVVSVPHHGSKTSSTKAFLQKVSPKIGLISAGYRSRFGHPKPEIVSRYQDLGVELLDTVNYGAISLQFPNTNKEIEREYYRLEHRGFWSR